MRRVLLSSLAPRRLATLLSAAILLAALTGCITLGGRASTVLAYAIEARRPESPSTTVNTATGTLKIRPLRVTPMFEGRKLVYRRPGPTWQSNYYHEFFISPGLMLTGVVEQWLTASGAAGRVIPATSRISADRQLEGNILALYCDTTVQPPLAVIEMEFLLIDEPAAGANAAPKVAFQRVYRREEAIADAEPRQAVDGWNRALAGILQAFENDLRGLASPQ